MYPRLSKRKAAFTAAVTRQIMEYGVALPVVCELMRESGIEHMLACGCRWGVVYMPCVEHKGDYPKVCFCGHMSKLVDRSAICFKVGQKATGNHWRVERMKHWEACTGRKWIIPERVPKVLQEQEIEKRLFKEEVTDE